MITTTLTLVDGVRIVVPDSLDLITPYVLQEQQDWFEDEIKFLRHLLQPGQTIIDIGANYGVYTLSMAQAVGASGRVWAFEPATGTADLLAQGIAANRFEQVTLERSAVSSSPGNAQLFLHANSEFNSLVQDQATVGDSETVTLVTLDDRRDAYGWQQIDFLKMDAEGEEHNILKGGQQFFAELSPLVQYEVKAGTDLHLELVQAFANLGYSSYRLVPGLNLLIPFDPAVPPDGYLLNLFCCKPDRANQLAEQGFLLPSSDGLAEQEWLDQVGEVTSYPAYDWRYTLTQWPYGATLAQLWEETRAIGQNPEVEAALAFYRVSQDASLPIAERFWALQASFRQFEQLCQGETAYLRWASLARVARDYGHRSLAVTALSHLVNQILRQHLDLGEPFLAPGQRFDPIDPVTALGKWLLAAALEELERLSFLSSFYAINEDTLQRLQAIRDLGFASPEMERRLSLVQQFL